MTKPNLEEYDEFADSTVFDGFCHRQFNESLDGWRRTQIRPGDFSAVDLAFQIIEMADEINRLRREIWELKQR